MADDANPDVLLIPPGHSTLPLPLMFDPEKIGPPPPELRDVNDPFRFGWRYVRRILFNGGEVFDEVPLSWEGVLYPEEDDFVVRPPRHRSDSIYCYSVLNMIYRNDPSVVVLGDCRIDFGVAGLRPLGPDVVVLFGVRQWFRQGTFNVAVEGGLPILVIEVTSPNSRDHDLANKPDLFYWAGVRKYVIVDQGRAGTEPLRVIGYERGPRGWRHLPADEWGRIDLSPVSVHLGVENDRCRLFDAATGERFLDLTELAIAMEAAQARARNAEARARDAAKD